MGRDFFTNESQVPVVNVVIPFGGLACFTTI